MISTHRFHLSLWLFLILAFFYLLTLYPGAVLFACDSARFQFVGKVLGTAHTTGYPLFTVLSHGFVKIIPFGNLAWKVNLLTALFAILALLVLFRILLFFKINEMISFLTTLILGFTRSLWKESVLAEIYTFHLFFVAAVLYCFLKWSESKKDRYFYAATLIYAISFGNHLTMLVLLPGIFYLTMATDRKMFFDPIKIAWVLFSVAVGIFQYAYLFWRYSDPHAVFLHAQVFDFRSFVSFATGSTWKQQMFSSSLLEVMFKKVPKFLNGFFIEFFYLLVPLGIVGIAKFKIKKYNLFMLLCFVCNLIFAINYNIGDISSYFIPSYFIFAIYIGIGSQALQDRFSPKNKRVFYVFIVFMLICLLGINFHYNKFFTQPEKIQRSEKVKEMLKVMGKDAVFVAPDYGYLEIFHYYLLGEEMEKKSNLYVVFHELMNDVENYVTHNGKLYLIEQRKYLPEHLAVFCTENDVDQFTQKGFKAEKRYENLFRISQK